MSPTESNRCCSIPYTLVRSSDADHWRVLYLIKDNCHSTTRSRLFLYVPNGDSISKLIPDLSRQAQKSVWNLFLCSRLDCVCLCPCPETSVCVCLPSGVCLSASQHLECMSLSWSSDNKSAVVDEGNHRVRIGTAGFSSRRAVVNSSSLRSQHGGWKRRSPVNSPREESKTPLPIDYQSSGCLSQSSTTLSIVLGLYTGDPLS